jgi:hypothetical protein
MDVVIAVGERATNLLQQLWSGVLQSRKTDVEAALRRDFDLSRVVTPIEMMVGASYAVAQVAELQESISPYRLRSERAASVGDARTLRQRALLVIGWGRDLPDIGLVDPGLAPIWKPQTTPATMAPVLFAV